MYSCTVLLYTGNTELIEVAKYVQRSCRAKTTASLSSKV